MEERVVIVDDDEIFSSYLKERLLLDDVEDVTVFNDPKEAIEDLKQENSPRLVISDFQMPGLNGVELLNRLKSSCSPINAVILTSDPSLAKNSSFPVYNKDEKDVKAIIDCYIKNEH